MYRTMEIHNRFGDNIDKDGGGLIGPDGEPLYSEKKEPEVSKEEEPELDFFNYVASLGFQAMIFLGEVPNPMTQQVEKNLKQAKFLIDTLVLIREKTIGNLTKEEGELLNGSIFELQRRYVDIIKQ